MSEAFNALIFSKITETHGPGGMQRHLSQLVGWLAQAGGSVTLVTTSGGHVSGPSVAECHVIEGTRPGRYSRAWWSGTQSFVRERGCDAWDVIISEDGGAWGVIDLLKRWATRPPVVMFRHGTTLLSIEQAWRRPSLYGLAVGARSLRDYLRHPRRLSQYVDLMVVLSDMLAASVRREAVGPHTEVRVVPLGVDLTTFAPGVDPADARRRLDLQPDVLTLVWVARDIPLKRVELAMSVCEQLQRDGDRHQLVLAIASPRRGTIARVEQLSRRGIAIQLLRNASVDQLRTVYAAGDVQVFTSRGPEGVPLSILEGLACGLPVIAAASPGVVAMPIFREQPSWLIGTADLRQWAERIRTVTNGAGLAEARRSARRLAARYYDLRDTADTTVRLISSIVERRTPRRVT